MLGPASDLATVSAPLYWCAGNHEDFSALASLITTGDAVAVDFYRRCWFVRSGATVKIGHLRVGVVGGGPEAVPGGPDGGGARPGHVSESACLEGLDQGADILLTHCGPRRELPGLGFGSPLLAELVEVLQPAYHFFSHHKRPVQPATTGKTRSFHLADTSFAHCAGGPFPFGRVNAGCKGVLTVSSGEESHFEVVDEPWMADVTWQDFNSRKGL